ncbi:hypothetical protein JCGZ_18920 [Jatropha curcas]|uniref:Uncharacterized protein n=1 Tax=Jatropha curcas TaxID=180498 RepID=A0A067K6F2_JATCU|nr:hypothetical protein JCGZ_18920 [Jatropha curcas]
MARQADRLYKVGLEGFSLIDEWYGRPKRVVSWQHPEQKPRSSSNEYDNHVMQFPRSKMETTAFTSEEAAQFYGGVVIKDYRKKKQLFSA